MKKYSLYITLAIFLVSVSTFFDTQTAFASPTNLPSGFTATVLIDYNMIAPTGVKIAPDGRIFVFDLFGTIKIFNEGSGFLAVPFGSIAVNASGDRGLLGAVFDTDFANNPYVYIHYVGTDSKVRIGRFDASQNVGTNFTELYVSPLASGGQHAGGGIVMDKNGYLFFGIGDSGTPTNSQDLTTPHGKIHRIYRDGGVPTNPFFGQVGVPSTIYAYGVRNPFRMTMDKLSGSLYVGDVGYNTWEEVNLIEPGKNYGWAIQEGPCTQTCPYQNPVYWYAHQFGTNNTNDASIVLGPVYRGSLYPASYYGKAFVSDYVQGFLRTINPSVISNVAGTLSTNNGAVIDMDIAPNGKLYFVTISSPRLYRLDYTGGVVNQPPIAVATTTTTTGPVPLSVNFSSAGSNDPEGAALTYLWDFGDNSTSSLANPVKIYNQDGQYTVRLTVSDGVSSVLSNVIDIKVGSAPILNIDLPLGTALYTGGEIVNYSVTATEANGLPLASSSISTTIRLHHSDHSHPFAGPFIGSSGQVTTPVDGELSPDVWLRFIFDAVGASGVHTIKTVDVYPRLSQITVNTSPAGLNVILDGSNHVIPPTVQGVVGMNRQIAAPSPQMFGGTQYVFDRWSDNGAREHTFTFPATTTTYTAFYRAASTSTPINLVANGSFENSGSLPTNWRFSRWGNNNIAATLVPEGSSGSWSIKMEANQITSGDGRIYHDPIPVTDTRVYGVKYFRKNTVPFKAVADVTLQDNSHRYIWLGISQPSTGWLEQNWVFTTPANSKNVVINLYHTTTGIVQIDDFSLFDPNNVTVPEITAPDITLTTASTSIHVGATTTLAWSVFGTTPICLAGGGWQGIQTIAGSIEIAPTSTQSYQLTCSNSAGTSTKSITIDVHEHEHEPTSTSLITNPSAELHNSFDEPLDWTPTRWGTNNAVLEHEHGDAYDSEHSLTAIITNHTNGEAGWITAPIAVDPLTTYIFSEYTKSTGPTKVQVEVTLINGSKKYLWLGRLQNSSDWTLFTKEFVTPTDAKTIRIGTYLSGIGSLNMDLINLGPKVPLVPPQIEFSVDDATLQVNEVTTLRWSVTGSNLSCTASDGWSGTKSASGSQSISPSASTTYTLYCSNAYGDDTKSMTVSVEDIVPPPPTTNENLIVVNTDFGGSTPVGWLKGSWGNNTTQFSTANTGHTDSSSLQVSMTDYVDGDAKWIFEPVSVTGNTSYSYSNWYRTEAKSMLVAEYTLTGGSKAHEWLGSVPESADWSQKSVPIQTPAGATKLTVHHVMTSGGVLQTDDFSLIQN